MKLRLWRYEMTVTLRKRRKRQNEGDGRVIRIDGSEPMFSRDAIALVDEGARSVVLDGYRFTYAGKYGHVERVSDE